MADDAIIDQNLSFDVTLTHTKAACFSERVLQGHLVG